MDKLKNNNGYNRLILDIHTYYKKSFEIDEYKMIIFDLGLDDLFRYKIILYFHIKFKIYINISIYIIINLWIDKFIYIIYKCLQISL